MNKNIEIKKDVFEYGTIVQKVNKYFRQSFFMPFRIFARFFIYIRYKIKKKFWIKNKFWILINWRNIKRKNGLISKYREFDSYHPDIIIYKAEKIHIEQKLPSEPPSGITYNFCASGYFTKNRDIDYCVIYTEWRNVNNYCHWTFSEIPLIYLALSSDSKNVVIPNALLNAKESFQIRWWEILKKIFSHKEIIPLSRMSDKIKGIIPVNHDTSSSIKMIGKCEYKHYHHSRATPYCIDMYSKLRSEFIIDDNLNIPNFYINRNSRRLKNEIEVQDCLIDIGFQIVNLEDYSLDQQVMLFSNAEFVIGFHGAGLANLVFSTEKTCVLEIVDKDCVYPVYKDGLTIPGEKSTRTYFHLVSNIKKMKYYCLESQSYFLNIDKLKNIISKIKPDILIHKY